MSQSLPLLNPFVGREHEQRAYQRLLKQEQDGSWVLAITGQGGMGKSALLRHLKTHTPPETHVALLQFANSDLRSDPLNILEDLSGQLARHCDKAQVAAFRAALKAGREQIKELSKQIYQINIVGNEASQSGVDLSLNASDAAARREQERQVRAMVTAAFYDQLETYEPAQLALLLDTCEWLVEADIAETGAWALDNLLPGIHARIERQGQRCVAVITSRERPELTAIGDDCYTLSLPMLDRDAVDLYLEQIGMQDTTIRGRVYEITRGHALCISIIGTLWQEQDDHPLTLADLPKLQQDFNERALIEYVQKRLDKRLKTPFRELTRYSVLLRSFNLPMLQAIFPEFLPEDAPLDLWRKFIDYPYIEKVGSSRYAIHDLLRELQAAEIREQQPPQWQTYHQRALNYQTEHHHHSPDWYYHAIAVDESEGMLAWWKAVEDPRNNEAAYLGSLFDAAFDVTLKLSSKQAADRIFQLGRYYYSSYGTQLEVAMGCYQEALSFYTQASDRLGEANVRKAIGDVHQFRKHLDDALASYADALSLFQQVGDRLGEANCYLEQGRIALQLNDYKKSLELHDTAYQLYKDVGSSYSQACLLYYRSFVYEAMEKRELAIADAEQALAIAQSLDLPFVGTFQERLGELKGE